MRLFYFLPLLVLTVESARAADCYNLSTPSCDNLYINSAIDLTGASGAAIEITVSGNVIINADITLNGQNGTHLTTDNTDGVLGGPGASGGGGIFSADGEAGDGFTSSDGGAGLNNGVCNPGGGGGGGVNSPGAAGSKCNPSDSEGIAGTTFSFPSPFSGAFGGGGGGAYLVSPLVYDLGGGGGGGGGLHIQANGTITIKNGVKISARGGNGGNATNLGGAGGGGAGGVIWLEANGEIKNAGIFDVRGGAGGRNTKASAPRGGNGGKGGDGLYRLESNGTVISGSGLKNFGSDSKLTSDISCGTIAAAKENKNLTLQLMMGFMLSMIFGLGIKTLSRFRELT